MDASMTTTRMKLLTLGLRAVTCRCARTVQTLGKCNHDVKLDIKPCTMH